MPIMNPWPARYVAATQLPLVNAISFLWQNPCSATPWAYYETLKPALGQAFITFVSFGWDDVLRGFLRPKGLSCGHKKQKRPRGRPGFLRQLLDDDIGNNIGKHIPGAKKLRQRTIETGVKGLWRLDLAGQKVAFTWLLYSIVSDFYIDWQSGLVKASCTPGLFDWMGGCANSSLFFTPLTGWIDVPMTSTTEAVGCAAAVGVITIQFNANGFLAGEVQALNVGLARASFELSLFTNQDGGTRLDQTESAPTDPGQIAVANVGQGINRGGSFWLEVKATGTNWTIQTTYIVGSGMKF